jgi:hypothetical protein
MFQRDFSGASRLNRDDFGAFGDPAHGLRQRHAKQRMIVGNNNSGHGHDFRPPPAPIYAVIFSQSPRLSNATFVAALRLSS